jgi:hypothetical protein
MVHFGVRRRGQRRRAAVRAAARGGSLDGGDRGGDPAAPGGAVAGQHPRRAGVDQGPQRRDRALGLVGERSRLRTLGAGEHVPGRERVAHEERVGEGHVNGDAALRVPGHADHARRAGQVEHVAVVNLDHLGEPGRPRPAFADEVREEPEHRPDLHLLLQAGRLAAALRPGGIGRVDVHGHPVLATQPLGEADVVGVAVRQDDPGDVGRAEAERGELGEQLPAVAGQAGVDGGDALGRDDEVGGDDVVAEAVDVLADLHDGYDT